MKAAIIWLLIPIEIADRWQKKIDQKDDKKMGGKVNSTSI